FAFLLDVLCQEHDPAHPQGKQAIVDTYLEQVVKLGSPILRSEYCGMVATRLGIQDTFVFQTLKRLSARARRQAIPHQRESAPEFFDDGGGHMGAPMGPPPAHGMTMDATELTLCAAETE